MAPEEKNENVKKNADRAPSKRKKKAKKKQEDKQDNDFFVSNDNSKEEISEREIFTGDEDFYKLLSDSIEESEDAGKLKNRKSKIKTQRNSTISWIQRILIAGIITIAATMGYAIVKNKLG